MFPPPFAQATRSAAVAARASAAPEQLFDPTACPGKGATRLQFCADLASHVKAGGDRLRDRALSFGRDAGADFAQAELFTHASAIAFCVLFALVPFALFLVALLGFLDLTELWTRELGPKVAANVSRSVYGVLDETVRQIQATRQVYWLTGGLAVAVWELSNAVFAAGEALNRIYGLSEKRSLWRRLSRSIGLGICVGVCLLGTVVVTQLAPGLAERALGRGLLASVLGFFTSWGVAVVAAGRARRLALGRDRDSADRRCLDAHVGRIRRLRQRRGQLRVAVRRSRASVRPTSVPVSRGPFASPRSLGGSTQAKWVERARATRERG